ncbi:hypothetical protein MHU86_10377 [Fragilaria crotonensis]|nr:hypothetical protein MHU86_10377 [Fragilaria crotonensis]
MVKGMMIRAWKEHLVLNASPVDGRHKCQSSLRSAATALASATLYLDELATYYCTFKLFVDSSTSAISNVSAIRDLIPKQKFANNADILSTLCAAPDVLSHFLLYHVTSHQDATTDFDSLPFEAQLNVLFDCVATDQLARQGVNVGERTQSCSHCPASHLPVEVFLGHQNIQSHYIPRLRDALSSAGIVLFYKKIYSE